MRAVSSAASFRRRGSDDAAGGTWDGCPVTTSKRHPAPGTAFSGPVGAALLSLRSDPVASGWCRLPFFAEGGADATAARLDSAILEGQELAPAPDSVFRALRLTPLEQVKAVILGQDPYPRRGDANGLAFSHVGAGRMPPSLKVILRELEADLGHPVPPRGDLTAWAEQGVLLLNVALTTIAGRSGVHLGHGWARLADEAVAAVSASRPAVAFLLWGGTARRRAVLVDRDKHLLVESGHPSPLNRAADFPGTRPFSRANAFLASRGVSPVDWRL